MPQRREHPYIWATWLPRLLTGENSCEWAVWFKAHYVEWTRQSSDFDQAEWLMRHTALLNHQRQEWEDDGHHVFVETHGAYRPRGKTATLAGRPDLVVLDDRDASRRGQKILPSSSRSHSHRNPTLVTHVAETARNPNNPRGPA